MPSTLERQTVEFGSGPFKHRLHVFESNGVLERHFLVGGDREEAA